MKVKILRATAASGTHLDAGEVVDLPEKDAVMLVKVGKAEALEGGVVRKRATKSPGGSETVDEARKRSEKRRR